MSTVATSLPSFASIVADNRTDSNAVVGLAVSSRSIHFLCTLPFATVLALILPSLFSVRKINDSIAFFLSSALISVGLIGLKHTLSCSCFISFVADCSAFFPNFLIAFFKLYVSTNDTPFLLASVCIKFNLCIAIAATVALTESY